MLPFCPLTFDNNEAFLKSWGEGGGSKGPFAKIAHQPCLKFGSSAKFIPKKTELINPAYNCSYIASALF
jgi:hypothetical protein